MKISHLAVAFALTGSVHAAGFIDNFESYSPLYGNMNGQGGWVVTNGVPANPGDGPVVIVDAYTWDGSNQSATVGGVAPTSLGITSLTHSISGVTMGGLVPAVASWEMSFTESTGIYPHNPFSFEVNSAAGNLLTIYLNPSTPGSREVSWTSGLNPVVSSGYIPGVFGTISEGVITQFQITTEWDGNANIKFKLENAGLLIAEGIFLTGTSTTAINSFTTNLYTFGGAGNGSITLDNVSVIPEPSAALLGIMGMSLLFSRRRRA